MTERSRAGWFQTAGLTAAVYSAVGILFAMPSDHVRAWRLAAWVVSMLAYVTHSYFERVRLRNLAITGALHVGSAVALGAFGLALAALIHSILRGQSHEHHRLVGLALLVWPILTGLPAFVVAFAVNWLLSATKG